MNKIFENEPVQWGFRGDPHMWAELKEYFNMLQDDLDTDSFNLLLDRKFNKIIESDGKQTSKNSVWFAKYPQFGMSGGTISIDWWKETGLPLLKSRYAELKK